MGSWLSRWFKRSESPSGESAEVARAAPAPQAEPAQLTRDELLEAISLTLPPKAPAPPDAALAARILEEFRRARPVPASPPVLAMRILNLIAEPDPDPGELAKLVSLEPALTAGVLRVASSAAYRGIDKIENLRDAITRLGTREVASVCAALSTKSVFGPHRREHAQHAAAFNELFVHATATALAAASLALSLKTIKTKSDVVFLCAMLHDIGMSVGLSVLASLPALPGEGPVVVPAKHALQTLLDQVHVEVGAEIHREWKLPETALQICLLHHAPGPGAEGSLNELHIVRLASALQLLQQFPATEARVEEVLGSARFLALSKFALRSYANDVRRFTGTARAIGG